MKNSKFTEKNISPSKSSEGDKFIQMEIDPAFFVTSSDKEADLPLPVDTEIKEIKLAGLAEESLVDGPGIRLTIFTQGCPHRCPGCHNPETHSRVGGSIYSLEELVEIYRAYPKYSGLTLSGGEPFLQAKACARLAEEIKALGANIICYTGYYYSALIRNIEQDKAIRDLLDKIDLLIEGPFVLKQRSLEAPFVGSLNQRFRALTPVGKELIQQIPDLEKFPELLI